jgi:hypothetical protein
MTVTASSPMVADARCRTSVKCCAMSARQKNFDAGNCATDLSAEEFEGVGRL